MRGLAVLVVALAACGTPPPTWEVDAGACMPYVPPGTTDLMSPSISFKSDVMPLFNQNCGSSICHGIKDSPQGGLFLGAQLAKGADASTVYTDLMKTSGQLTSMPYITPGDPSKSYLMHKLDGDQCMFQTSCVGNDCLKPMPYDVGSLEVEQRDIVRRWIAQGAPTQ